MRLGGVCPRFGLLFVLVLGGCGSEEPGDAGSGGNIPTAGDSTLTWTGDALELARRGRVLLVLPKDGLVLGRVAALDDATNYDPHPLVTQAAGYTPPAGLEWLGATEARVTRQTQSELDVELEHGNAHRSLLLARVTADDNFALTFTPELAGDVAYLRLAPRTDATEGFYGLGEYFDDVNHRGHVRAMQLELQFDLESSYNEAHVPVPFVIGTTGWGLFVEDPHPAAFEMAVAEADRSTITFGTGGASASGLRFHLFAAEHALDVTRHYYDVAGYPGRVARWALGPWIWRDENDGQAQVEADLNAIRDLDLATTGYWIDRPYATGVNTFDYDPAKFPDAPAMIGLMHALGFRHALWHTPYLDEADPATQPLRDEAVASGFFPPQTGLLFNPWGKPIDLTNQQAFAWWQSLLARYEAQGVEGYKLDYMEDIVPGLFGARNVWRFADGSDERTQHALFQLLYHRVYAEMLPEQGGFLLCRGGTYGDQVHGVIIWPGDLDANFARHGDPIPGESQRYVGGLPASVIAGLSLGPSGFPFYGADTGGYRHSPPDKETFTRWFQQTALSSVMQIGTSTNDVAWEPTPENGFDAEMLEWYRRYTRLHLRLWPYEWTYVERIRETGRPITRPLGLAYPELGVHPNDIYLFGDDLLVAPVVERGQVEREVILPPGRWVDWWTGAVHEGSQTIRVAAPLDTLPLFLREGGIVPLLRPTIDALSPTTEPERVDSYATTPGVLYARIAAGARSEFVLFDGARIAQERSAGTIRLSSEDGSEFSHGVVFEVLAVSKPSSVSDGGAALEELTTQAELETAASGWLFDPTAAGGTLWVKVPAGSHDVSVSI